MGYFFFDTETFPISDWEPAPVLVCGQCCDEESDAVLVIPQWIVDRTRAALHCGATTVVAHNLKFDAGVLVRHSPDLLPEFLRAGAEGRLICTLIAARLQDLADGTWTQDQRYSLGVLATRYGLPEKKDPYGWRLRFSELHGKPIERWPQAALDYGKGDAEILRALFYCLRLEPSVATATSRAVALQLLSLRGVVIDGPATDAFEADVYSRRCAANKNLRASGILREDGSKDVSLLRGLVEKDFAGRGFLPPKTAPTLKFPKGQTQTSREVLEDCSDPALKVLVEAGEDDTFQRLTIPALRSPRGTVHASYDFPKRSGRATAHKPNIGQLPRRGPARDCVVARDGCVFVISDFCQAELCALAQICLEEGIGHARADAINAGVDIHIRTAKSILGRPYNSDTDKEVRQVAKMINFGRPGRLGVKRLSAKLKCSKAQAKRIIQAHDSEWPEVPGFLDWAEQQHSLGEPAVVHPSGRKRKGSNWGAMANTRFQGRVADGALSALFHLSCECYLPTGRLRWVGAWPVIFAHDEIVVETVDWAADLVREVQDEVMVREMQAIHPGVKIRADSHIARTWRKT